MNKDKLKNAIENIDPELVSEARNYAAGNLDGKEETKNTKGAVLSVIKPVAIAAVFLIFVTAGIAAAIMISGSRSRSQTSGDSGRNDETFAGQTEYPVDRITDPPKPDETMLIITADPAESPHEVLFPEETYKLSVMSDKLRFMVIAGTPWYIADIDYGLNDDERIPGSDPDAGKLTIGYSEALKMVLFRILDGKNIIKFVQPVRPFLAIEARYSENDTSFDYLFCLYDTQRAMTVKDLNTGLEVGSVGLTSEEVAEICQCAMPELRTISSTGIFVLRNIDHIDRINVSTLPESPKYRMCIDNDGDIGIIMKGICQLHAIKTAENGGRDGMVWVLEICYEGRENQTVYLTDGIKLPDGNRYSVPHDEISRIDELLWNLLSANK